MDFMLACRHGSLWRESTGHDDVIKWRHFPRYVPFVRRIHRLPVVFPHKGQWLRALMFSMTCAWTKGWAHNRDKQRVLMHGHQGWNVRHGLCHIYMIYVYIWVVYSFCLFCGLFIIVTTQFVALYKPCKPKPKPSTYDPLDNHPLAEIQRPILRPEPKQ